MGNGSVESFPHFFAYLYMISTKGYASFFALVIALFGLCFSLYAQSGKSEKDDQAWQLLQEKGDTLVSEGKIADGILAYQQSLDILSRIEDWENLVVAHMYIGFLYLRMGSDYPSAERALDHARELASEYLDASHKHWEDIFYLYGMLYKATGDYDLSIEYYLQSIDFQQRKAEPEMLGIASSYNNLGMTYFNKGDFVKAIEYLKTAISIKESIPGIEKVDFETNYANLGLAYLRNNQYQEALSNFLLNYQLIRDHEEKFGDKDFLSAYNNLAIVLTYLEQYDLALSYLQKALKIHERTSVLQEKTYHNLAHIYRETRQSEKALTYYQQAIKYNIATLGSFHPDIAKQYRHMAIIEAGQGNFDSSLDLFQKSLATLAPGFSSRNFHDNPSPDSIIAKTNFLRTLRDKAQVLQIIYNKTDSADYLKAAHKTHLLAVALIDRMRKEFTEGSKQFWTEETLPMFERAIQTAEEMFQLTDNHDYLYDAFNFAEKSKAVLLADAVKESGARRTAGIPDSLFVKEQDLKRDLAEYEKQLFLEKRKGVNADSLKTGTWQKKVFDLRRAHEQLIVRMEKNFPDYYKLKYETDLAGVEEIQAHLKARQSGLIEYFMGGKNLFTFVLTPDTIVLIRQAITDEVSTHIRILREILTDRDLIFERGRDPRLFTQFTTQAYELYQFLIAPVAEIIPSHILIIPDGILGYLPFEILISQPPQDGAEADYASLPFLLKRFRLRYEYSANVMMNTRPHTPSSRHFAGFAPDYSSSLTEAASAGEQLFVSRAGFAPLTHNKPEVRAISRRLRGRSFVGNNATERRFTDVAGDFQILHLAMHAFTNDENPLYSALVFSEPEQINDSTMSENTGDGFLYAYELYNLNLSANLAVLSACNTGTGKLARGEGVMSLARAFKFAGVPNVVMSLWQAEDRSTAEIMKNFYRNLDEGMDKDEALRQAKLSFIENSRNTHPFFWATFVLIGDEQPMDLKPSLLWYWIIGISLVLGGFIIFFRKKRIPH